MGRSRFGLMVRKADVFTEVAYGSSQPVYILVVQFPRQEGFSRSFKYVEKKCIISRDIGGGYHILFERVHLQGIKATGIQKSQYPIRAET
jgi:hypothetical protein